ncbi:MAG: glycosyltransferase family 2 protein [Armatimonadetes bacterium]|nr:glycosyltransferase family 2 protein [Armatimonadota bacterium]
MCNIMDSPSSLRLSIVYVSWNTTEELRKSLEALIATGIPEDTEVLVVDNASTDGTPEEVRAIFPRVRLIVNTENRGFAAAFNQGWRAATGRFCLLLNPDTSITPATISIMLGFMESCSTFGACAPVLVGETGETTDNARPFPPLTLRLDKQVRSRPHGEPLNVPTGPWGRVTRAHWLMGACVLLRREALEATGGFDEGYFLYAEDIDWCYRAFCADWEVALLEDRRAVHLGGRSAAQVEWGLSMQRLYDGYFRFLTRAHGGIAARANFLWWLFKCGGTVVLLAPFSLFSPSLQTGYTHNMARFRFCLTHLGAPFLLCRFGRNHAPPG